MRYYPRYLLGLATYHMLWVSGTWATVTRTIFLPGMALHLLAPCAVHNTQYGQSFILDVDLTLSLVFGNNQPTTEQGWSISFNLLFQIFENQMQRDSLCQSEV